MSFYVRIRRLNGRNDHCRLADWVNRSGLGAVDYNEGGWNDGMIHNAAPHLRFDLEEDAIAYVLANGGTYTTRVPEAIPGVDYLPGG